MSEQVSSHLTACAKTRIVTLTAFLLLGLAINSTAQTTSSSTDTGLTSAWQRIVSDPPSVSSTGNSRAVRPHKFRAFALNHAGIRGFIASAPREHSKAARDRKMMLSLPAPGGAFQRFAIWESSIME